MFKFTIKTLEEFLSTKELIIVGNGVLDYPNSDNFFTKEMYCLCGQSYLVDDNVIEYNGYKAIIEPWMCSHWEELEEKDS